MKAIPCAAGLLTLAVLLGAGLSIDAREWVSADGSKLDADFISATDSTVTIKRSSDGREFTLRLGKLSEADRAWIAENKDKEPEPEPLSGPYAGLVTGDWALSEFDGLPFALRAPSDLNPAKKYPLVLGLHGKSQNNENGNQKGILRAMTTPDVSVKHPAILVAPLCYQPYGGTGSGWGDKPGEQAIKLVESLVENLPVDEDRIYCLGNSMGGGGTSTLICNEPRLFAAGIVICGWAPGEASSVFKKVPVWAFHGSDDKTVPPATMRRLAEDLKRSDTYKYTEFEGEGHGIGGKVWSDPAVAEWLFSQRKK